MEITKTALEELRILEESLWKAETRFNDSYMENILAHDFFEFGRSGQVYRREDTLGIPYSEIKSIFPLENFQVHTIDTSTVLVTYVSNVIYEVVERANRSSLWTLTPAGWKLRFHQGTPVNI